MHLIEKNENCAFNGHFLKTKQNIDDKHWIQHITNKATTSVHLKMLINFKKVSFS